MRNREEGDSYRAQILRRLKSKYRDGAPPEVLEAEKVIARFREEEAKDRETEARLGLELPDPHSCPECFYLHGNNSVMISIRHEDPKHWDRWKCRVCEYVEDIAVGIRTK